MPQFVSASVQFLGADNVKKAFHNVGVLNWALFNGKSLLEKYDGDEETQSISLFNQYIDALDANGSEALYRLQTYEDLKPGEKIKPSTECDRSFQFKLYDRYGGSGNTNPNSGRTSSFEQKILDELSEMKTKIAMLERDDDQDDDQLSGFGASLKKLLDIPAVQNKIGQVFESLADHIIPPRKTGPYQAEPPRTAAALNGVPSSDEAAQIEKINLAIQQLYQVDPALGDHLQKLAAIATNDVGQYNKLISMLNNLF